MSEATYATRLPLLTFFPMAEAAALRLKEIHGRRPFHGCINTMTLGLHQASRQHNASSLLSATLEQQHLAYISPEQTGRMNRSVDYRSDFYSLGVVYYELLTGQLPFSSSDAMELVHCHIAQQPVPPSSIVPGLPKAVSEIVLKLLSKNAEDRYQSVEGLLADLRYCESALKEEGKIGELVLGRYDLFDRLQFSNKLYGREQEIHSLMQAYESVSQGGTELMLVSGYSGVGKSSLVNEFHKIVAESGGIYLSGKFDQYKRNIPYATLAHAFQGFVRQILGGSEVEVTQWREALLQALGNKGRLLVDLIPELEFVIGKQAPMSELSPSEAENRFLSAFAAFLKVFAKAGRPLVLFLDDLQWMDVGSMKLLEHLTTHAGVRYLLLIAAYRDNEVEPVHMVARSLAAIRRNGGTVHDILLGPLASEDMVRMVADALRCEQAHIAPLAQMLYAKTGGNPFFAVQFLTTLYEEGLLTYDAKQRSWCWDIEQIRAKDYTDNVVDLMLTKVQRLSAPTLTHLKHLACLGRSASLPTLAELARGSQELAQSNLDEAMRLGFVSYVSDRVGLSHDRIQEAVYSLIPEQDRSAMHLNIGRMLMARMTSTEIDAAVFDLAHQFDCGISLISDPAEKEAICRLNAMAGKKARASAAYASACSYLRHAIKLLASDDWETHYEDTYALHIECAECEFVIGNHAEADALISDILAHARSNHDKARALLVRIRMYFLAGRGRDCLEVGLEALLLFGITFPKSDQELIVYGEQARQALARRLEDTRVADLIDLPVATDPDVRMVICLLAELMTPAYSVWPPIAMPMLAKALTLSLDYGNIEDSCVIYSNYGLLLAGIYDDIATGFAFSDMSLRLNEKFQDAKLRGRVLFIHGYAFNNAEQPLAECAPVLEQAFLACREVGNIGFAGASIDAFAWMTWESGKPLEEVVQIAAPYKDFTRQHNTFNANCGIHLLELFKARMQGAPNELREKELLALIGNARKFMLGHYYIVQQVSRYTFMQYEEALEFAQQAGEMPSSLRALACMVTHHFYYALTLIALYARADAGRRTELKEILDSQMRKLRLWADVCPENYGDRYALVRAEWARVEGAEMSALLLYEKAIAAAREHGFLQNEALANELLGRFYFDRGFTTSALAHLRIACECYRRWGATAKAAQIEQRYLDAAADGVWNMQGSALAGGRMQDLDVTAVVKASQAVSGEIVLGKLTESLLQTVMEHAGAQRGLLILPTDGTHHIAAEATVDGGQTTVNLRQAPVTAEDLPFSIFQYVVRTGERVLLDDATGPGPYAGDPYTRGTGVKSVLCLPLLKQAKLLGILHLENRLTAGVFTPSRIAMLELLASQAVISLENATLYSELQTENAGRKRVEEALRLKTNELQAHASFMNVVIENIPVAVFVKDARDDFRFTLWNKAAEDMFKMKKQDVIGKLNHELWQSDQADRFLNDDRIVASDKRLIDLPEQTVSVKNLGNLLLHTIKVPLVNPEDGQTDYLLGISENITERKKTESLIWQQANFDSLTGLPNRSRFREQLKQDIAHCKRDKSMLAVLFIDLDRFKEVNDTLGHDKGDALLVEAAARIRACVRETDTVGRQGGDEFTVILSKLFDPNVVGAIAQKIIESLAMPFQLGQEQAFISASIGITVYPNDATEIEELLKHADQALYVAKDSGRNRFGYFTPALQAAALHRMRLTNDLRGALDHNELRVYFQPIVSLETGRVHKAEALIRWQHPQRGMVSPAEFIPLAEASGLIVEIGDWVFRESARWVKRWRDEHDENFQISVNQSPLEFQRQGSRYDRWVEYLRSMDLPGQAIVVEITEGLLLDVTQDVTNKLLKLRDAGIQVALDDFGTGYSSLAYLKKFDIDYLKIDQAFTRNLAAGSSDMALCEAIVVMAHKLGLKVIAEGVETTEQHDLLRGAGCDYDQGYLFARPMPAEEFDAFLRAMRLPKPKD
jgi:diguanylate cyclase (GGDEF)-like protein/PAS domain S-box-containing protein